MKVRKLYFVALAIVFLQGCGKEKLSYAQRSNLMRHVVVYRHTKLFEINNRNPDYEFLKKYEFRSSSRVSGLYTSTWGATSDEAIAAIFFSSNSVTDSDSAPVKVGYYVISPQDRRVYVLSLNDDGTTGIGILKTRADNVSMSSLTFDSQICLCKQHFENTNDTVYVIQISKI